MKLFTLLMYVLSLAFLTCMVGTFMVLYEAPLNAWFYFVMSVIANFTAFIYNYVKSKGE